MKYIMSSRREVSAERSVEKDLSTKIELKDIILGGQDGLVNVLGISLGLAAANASSNIIFIAGLSAGLAEAISMGGVAYTSSLADDLRLANTSRRQIVFSSVVVGLSALLGSVVPLISFLFFSTAVAIGITLLISMIILFVLGIFEADHTGSKRLRSGLQIVTIGLLSAFAGFTVGLILKI